MLCDFLAAAVVTDEHRHAVSCRYRACYGRLTSARGVVGRDALRRTPGTGALLARSGLWMPVRRPKPLPRGPCWWIADGLAVRRIGRRGVAEVTANVRLASRSSVGESRPTRLRNPLGIEGRNWGTWFMNGPR